MMEIQHKVKFLMASFYLLLGSNIGTIFLIGYFVYNSAFLFGVSMLWFIAGMLMFLRSYRKRSPIKRKVRDEEPVIYNMVYPKKQKKMEKKEPEMSEMDRKIAAIDEQLDA